MVSRMRRDDRVAVEQPRERGADARDGGAIVVALAREQRVDAGLDAVAQRVHQRDDREQEEQLRDARGAAGEQHVEHADAAEIDDGDHAAEDRPGDGAADDRVDLEQVVLHDRVADREREEQHRQGDEVEREADDRARRTRRSRRPGSTKAATPPSAAILVRWRAAADGGRGSASARLAMRITPPAISATEFRRSMTRTAANERWKARLSAMPIARPAPYSAGSTPARRTAGRSTGKVSAEMHERHRPERLQQQAQSGRNQPGRRCRPR